jgi:hypothetical protein
MYYKAERLNLFLNAGLAVGAFALACVSAWYWLAF